MGVYAKGVIRTAVELNAHDCPSCGVVYAITEEFEQRRRDDGATFYCPNGHHILYKTTPAQTLQAELDQRDAELARLRTRTEFLDEHNKQLANDLMDKVKEQKRLEKRIHAGVCPYCKRTFQNVARHMGTQHEGKKKRPSKTANSRKASTEVGGG